MVCSHCPTPRPTKKMSCAELFEGVHTAQRQTPKQIPVGFCSNLLASMSVSVSVSVSVSGSVNAPLGA